GTKHIQYKSITGEKIAEDSISSDHIQEDAILSKHLGRRVINAEHLFSSKEDNVILGVKEKNTDPQWMKINGDMIEDFAITPAKMYQSKDPYRVLGVKDPDTPPEYLMITGKFIEDKSIESSKLADDLVLRGSPSLTNHPSYASDSYAIPTTSWVRRIVMDAMGNIGDVNVTIPRDALMPGSPRIEVRPPANASDVEYTGNLIPDCQWVLDRIKETYDKIIEMEPDLTEDIWGSQQPGCGTGSSGSGSGTAWCGECVLQEITAEDVENTWDNNGVEPDYEPPEDPWDAHCMMKQIAAEIVQRIWDTDKISSDFDITINWPTIGALGSDGLLRLEVPDDYDGPAFSLINGKLRATGDDDVVDRLKLVDGKLVFIGTEELYNQANISIDSDEDDIISKLRISEIDPQASTSEDQYPHFKIEIPNLMAELPDRYSGPSFSMEDGYLYAEGEESEIKKYSIINGEAVVELSDGEHECRCDIEEVTEEWVKEVWDDELNRIENGSGGNCNCDEDCSGTVGNGSITALKLAMGAVTTSKIANRAVTGSKLFTSIHDYTVLAVKEAGSDPEYLKITREMLDDSRIIDGSRLFSSYTPNMILAVTSSGGDPQWVKIKNEFLDDNIIQNRNIADEAITGRKIQDRSIGANKLADEPMIDSEQLIDRSVTERKIDFDAVRTEHIQDGSITGDKLAENIVIPAYPTVEAHTDHERRSLRNTILSPNPPKGGQNGDIWFRYI
ncbi:MAG: hypothetical protein NC548_48350, partial [Lachnospiraceae bacterium]|nr:hypothetical protein [Lachnospiraceae bacterium]